MNKPRIAMGLLVGITIGTTLVSNEFNKKVEAGILHLLLNIHLPIPFCVPGAWLDKPNVEIFIRGHNKGLHPIGQRAFLLSLYEISKRN